MTMYRVTYHDEASMEGGTGDKKCPFCLQLMHLSYQYMTWVCYEPWCIHYGKHYRYRGYTLVADCPAPDEKMELNAEETEAFLKLFAKPAEKLILRHLKDVDPLSPTIRLKLRLKKKPVDGSSILPTPTSPKHL